MDDKMCPLLAMGRLAKGNMAFDSDPRGGQFFNSHCRRAVCAWWCPIMEECEICNISGFLAGVAGSAEDAEATVDAIAMHLGVSPSEDDNA